MSVRAATTYTLVHPTGQRELVEVEVSTDAAYSPDIASDLAARARSTLAATVRDVWPETAEVTP